MLCFSHLILQILFVFFLHSCLPAMSDPLMGILGLSLNEAVVMVSLPLSVLIYIWRGTIDGQMAA